MTVGLLSGEAIAEGAQSSEEVARVRGALESLRSGIRGDESRYGLWNETLLLDDIDKQLDAGKNSDSGQLTKAIGALAGAERSVDKALLENLRDSLQNWLDDKPKLKIGDASGADSENDEEEKSSDNDEGDAEDEDESDAEDEDEEKKSELTTAGAEPVVEAVDKLNSWLKRQGPRYGSWSDGLGLDDIESLAESPEDATRVEVQKQLSRIITECNRQNRSDYVRLRRALQAWQVADRFPVDEPLAAEARRRKLAFPGVDQNRLINNRTRLQQATSRLGSFLDTSEEYGANWKKFLEWEKLETALNGSGTPLVRPLLSVYNQFSSGEPGLKVRQFSEARQALDDYLQLLQLNERRPERLTESRRELLDTMRTLDNWLQLAPEKREKLWREFLDLDALAEQMEDSVPDGRKLTRILKKFEAEEDGLDHRKFVAVHDRLEKYLELLSVSQGSNASDIYTQRVEKIAQLIEQHILDPTNDTAANLVRELRWLESTGLMPGLAAKIKSLNARPNFFASLSGDLITRALQDRITDTQGINRMFEGSHVTGSASTVANVSAQLIPSNNGVLLDILLNGSTVANSVAQKRKVFVRTQGTTYINGGTRLYLGLDGVRATPASVSASTNQQVCNICINRRCTCGNRLIRRIAGRKAEQSRPKAEYMQTDEAEQTIRDRINRQTQEMVGQANSRMQTALAKLNIPRKFMPEVSVRSTDRKVLSQGRLTIGSFLAAVSDPPDVGSESDVTMQLHQSAINNVLAELLGGGKLDNKLIVKLLKENNLPVPEELQPDSGAGDSDEDADEEADGEDDDDESDYWSITFDELQPATVTFSEGKLRISIRGRKFEQGAREVNEPIEISANYRLRKNSLRQLEAKRIGDLDVVFVRKSTGRLSTKQLAYKTAIKKRMELLFRRKLSIDDLPTPAPGSAMGSNPQVAQLLEQLRVVAIDEIEATRGWLALAVDLSNIDLKSQLGISMSGDSDSPNAALPAYDSRYVPISPASCQQCQPARRRRRGLFRRRR